MNGATYSWKTAVGPSPQAARRVGQERCTAHAAKLRNSALERFRYSLPLGIKSIKLGETEALIMSTFIFILKFSPEILQSSHQGE